MKVIFRFVNQDGASVFVESKSMNLPGDAKKGVESSRHRLESKRPALRFQHHVRGAHLDALEPDIRREKLCQDFLKSRKHVDIVRIRLNRIVTLTEDGERY